jgi:hypothetical protein
MHDTVCNYFLKDSLFVYAAEIVRMMIHVYRGIDTHCTITHTCITSALIPTVLD